MRSLESSDPQRQPVGWWGPGLGEGRGSECFMGTELQSGKMESSGDGWWRWFAAM